MLPFTFPTDPPLLEITSLCSQVKFLAGIKLELYDCCPNSCCCYTRPHKLLRECPYCKEPQFRSDVKPHKKFTYILLIPCLKAFARNQAMATKIKYRGTEHVHELGKSSDIFDSSNYQNLYRQHVEVNGRRFEHKCFDDDRDIALGLSTDGFAPFKQHKNTAWPLIIFKYSLPPEIWFHIDNILSLRVIPGPKNPVNVDSFLWPLIKELLRLVAGIQAYYILTFKVFALL
jgi:hypothetical protein